MKVPKSSESVHRNAGEGASGGASSKFQSPADCRENGNGRAVVAAVGVCIHDTAEAATGAEDEESIETNDSDDAGDDKSNYSDENMENDGPSPLAHVGVAVEDDEAAEGTAANDPEDLARLPRAQPIVPGTMSESHSGDVEAPPLGPDLMDPSFPGDEVYANVMSVDKEPFVVKLGATRFHGASLCLGFLAVCAVVSVLGIVFGVTGIVGGGIRSGKSRTASTTLVHLSPTNSPTSPSLFNKSNNDINITDTNNTEDFAATLFAFCETLSEPERLRNQSSPQYVAYSWVLESYGLAGIDEDDLERLQQRYAIAVMHFGVGGAQLDTVLNLYDIADHECDMNVPILDSGIFCDVREDGFRYITTIRIPVDLLFGELQNEIHLLPHLRVFDVSSNLIGGTIPSTLGLLQSLEELRLGRNHLAGTIPSELGEVSSLKVLSLPYNTMLTGTIPSTLGKLTNLKTLDLSRNSGIIGSLPVEFASLTSLEYLFLQETSLQGTMDFMCDDRESSFYGFLSDCTPSANLLEESEGNREQEVQCSCCTGCYADWYRAADDMPLVCPPNQIKVELTVQTDGNGHETTWNLTVGEINVATGGTYFSRRTYNHRLCVPDDRCYTWEIFDRRHNAMCCLYGQGSFSFKVDDVELSKGFRPTSAQFGSC